MQGPTVAVAAEPVDQHLGPIAGAVVDQIHGVGFLQ
jgi:hypothetical protein